MEKNAGQGGTVNATRWAMKRWNVWLEKRGIVIDISSVVPEVLAGHLCRFYAELKGKNNKPLSPNGLIGIRAGIQSGLVALRTSPLDIVKATPLRAGIPMMPCGTFQNCTFNLNIQH